MKCPKCKSTNTKKVSVRDPEWQLGHQRCNACGHQAEWGLFCDPPLIIDVIKGRKRVVIG